MWRILSWNPNKDPSLSVCVLSLSAWVAVHWLDLTYSEKNGRSCCISRREKKKQRGGEGKDRVKRAAGGGSGVYRRKDPWKIVLLFEGRIQIGHVHVHDKGGRLRSI